MQVLILELQVLGCPERSPMYWGQLAFSSHFPAEIYVIRIDCSELI